MSKTRRPSYPPSDTPNRPRSRAPSLTVARSAAALTVDHHPTSPTPADQSPTESHVAVYPPGPSSSLTRTNSRPKPALSAIQSDEDLTSPSKHVKAVAFDDQAPSRYSVDESYDRLAGSLELDAEGEGEGEQRGRYEGDFQKPDSKELLAIGLSIAGVSILALAAGLTTVLNWVL